MGYYDEQAKHCVFIWNNTQTKLRKLALLYLKAILWKVEYFSAYHCTSEALEKNNFGKRND